MRTEQVALGEVLNFFLRDMAFMLILAKIKGYGRLVLGGQFFASHEERGADEFFQFPCLICAVDEDPHLAVLPLQSNTFLFYQPSRLQRFRTGSMFLEDVPRPPTLKIAQVSASPTHSLVLSQ